jgi:hypothetical protein
MNYREWLLYRAQQFQSDSTEAEVLRYDTWRNHEAVREWMRRSDAAHMTSFLRNGQHSVSTPS